MKKLKNNLCFLFVCLFLFSCEVADPGRYIVDSSFEVALDSAKKENKYLWVLFGSKTDCAYSEAFLKALTLTGVFEAYKDKFVFYVMDISKESDALFYKYIILPGSIPNSYIFDNDGYIVSLCLPGEYKPEDVEAQLQKVVDKKPSNPILHKFYSIGGRRLINHMNQLIKANRLYLSSKGNVDSLAVANELLSSIGEPNRNFYYYYLNTMIALGLKDSVLVDSCATMALKKYDSGMGSLFFSDLQEKIKPFSKSWFMKSKDLPILSFEKEVIACGTLKRGDTKDYKLKFKNTGTLPLVILNTTTSCDCVTITYPKKPLKAGEQAEVNFSYDARVKGAFTRTVHFRSNALNSVQSVTLIGNCK